MKSPKSTKPESGKDTGYKGVKPDIIRGAKNNDLSEVKAALELNSHDITKQDGIYGLSALHYAAAKGNAYMVDYLLQQDGVNIDLKDRWERDVLDVAILSGNQKIIQSLFTFRHQDNDGEPDDPRSNGPTHFPQPR
jgi:ankyrin repeat protein